MALRDLDDSEIAGITYRFEGIATKVSWREVRDYSRAVLEAARNAPQAEPIMLEHVAVAEDGGELRWLTARKPRDCELYAMPDGGRLPTKLYAAPQPALTEAQVAAIEFAIGFMDGNPPCMKDVAVLEELLKGLA